MTCALYGLGEWSELVSSPEHLGEELRQRESRADSYRRFAEVFHHVLSEQSLDLLLDRIADALADLVPHDILHIYEADLAKGVLCPKLARDPFEEEVMNDYFLEFGHGITGWAVEHREPVLANEAHLDSRVRQVPGTPVEPESLICIPLIARSALKGALNIYRVGEDVAFTQDEFAIACLFGDAAGLAIDNAQIRASLELQAQTDSLTGLYNHRHFHERLRSELNRASRAHDMVSLLMFDIDDFKRVNDVYGHSVGDQVLLTISEAIRSIVRTSDVPCRVGGEEFAIILPSSDAGDALHLGRRLEDRLAGIDFDPAGRITVSTGISQGPEHAMNPRGLVACAEGAMMTAKARGKNRIVLYEQDAVERPEGASVHRDVRSIAHLKMLQSLAGKLNRLNDVEEIGSTIANELRTLIDYHNCRVSIVEGDTLVPVAFRGEFTSEVTIQEQLRVHVGEGVSGRAASTGRSMLIPNALECDFAVQLDGTPEIEESLLVVPLSYGPRVIGVVAISKLGVSQFDEDDLRLLEVLAGQASVALENARLYAAQRREASNAQALLNFADELSRSPSFHGIGVHSVDTLARLLEVDQVMLWTQEEVGGEFVCQAHTGMVGDSRREQIVRARIDERRGFALTGDRKDPWIAGLKEAAELFGVPADNFRPTTAICPLDAGDGLLGWFAAGEPASGSGLYFTEVRLRFLAGLTYQASSAMQKARLYRGQKESAEIANSLLSFSRELSVAHGLDEILSRTVELAARFLGSPRTSVWLADPETGDLLPEALWGFDEGARRKLAGFNVPAELTHPLIKAQEPFVVGSDERPFFDNIIESAPNLSYVVAPLHLDHGRAGALVAAAPVYGGYDFSERKMRLLAGIADQAKVAITSGTSFESLERTFVSTVEALANALEAKDEYTSTHARWITDMALEVGQAIGMDQQELKRLELGALFHDIGKIGIPSRILSKPGPLDDAEWMIIKTHPELGERILAPIERLSEVRPIVRHCHEHYDGSGYPDRRHGEAIPLESRIILVCDAFHAMTTDRPYRSGLPAEEALRRLRLGSGGQFDPRIVSVFLGILENRPELVAAG